MRCTIHPASAQDVASVVIGHDAWSEGADGSGRDCLDALLEACAMSRQVWTAANAEGAPLAFIGAAPWAEDADRGRLWFVVLAAYDGNDTDLKSVMRLTVLEMLRVFAQLENHVSPDKAWALELMRDAGFIVEPAQLTPDGDRRHPRLDRRRIRRQRISNRLKRPSVRFQTAVNHDTATSSVAPRLAFIGQAEGREAWPRRHPPSTTSSSLAVRAAAWKPCGRWSAACLRTFRRPYSSSCISAPPANCRKS